MTPPADEPIPNGPNDWTIMFFFASDNPLAPLLVSQLKAIKDAGFQEHTEVLAYFDPMEKGFPTQIYNVNHKRKAYARSRPRGKGGNPRSRIGDGTDSFIRKMEGDEVDSSKFSLAMQAAMTSSGRAHEALEHFVNFGITNHPARNYMLFLIGHGMIVGRDMFLPDEDPVSAITLKQLQKIMKQFVVGNETSLQLLALHSCSMSSIEVAYELRGTANYMMAHQAPAFVNSWPYRQLLKKIFNAIERNKSAAKGEALRAGKKPEAVEQAIKDAEVDIKALVEDLYFHCLHNATDFTSAGYSADLALCSLEEKKLQEIKRRLQPLVRTLKANLESPGIVKDQILLAHWESQSFWEENYTDLYDFCDCLSKGCNDKAAMLETETSPGNSLVQNLRDVRDACNAVKEVLDVREWAQRFDGLVIQEDHFGSKYHFARGLSVYFPWCEPLDDEPVPTQNKGAKPRPGQSEPEARSNSVLRRYMEYDFNADVGDDAWGSFLKSYFKDTKRMLGDTEYLERFNKRLSVDVNFIGFGGLMEKAALLFNSDGTLGSRTPEVGTRTPETGISCTCPTIKNYPTDVDKRTRTRRVKKFVATPGALMAFRDELQLVEEDSGDKDDGQAQS